MKLSNRKPLCVSASQLGTWGDCWRKWWLEKIARASTADKGYFDFGTVLHAVAERWLNADERGVDPLTGEPVELYPEGWHIAEDNGVPLPYDEQSLIKRLIAKAIDEGILRRIEGRVIEARFDRPLAEVDGVPVTIVGFIDVLNPTGIEDHKTLGNWRYALTPAGLQKNQQLLLYVNELLHRLKESGQKWPDHISVRHNQFGKDTMSPRVQSTEGFVTPAEAQIVWEAAKASVLNMLVQRERKEWSAVPGPAKIGNGPCRKYGGCDFLDICTGQRDVPQHNSLMDRLNQDRLEVRRNDPHGDTETMSSLSDLMDSRGGAQTQEHREPPATNSGLAEAAAAQPTTQQAAGAVADAHVGEPGSSPGAPWYWAGGPGLPKECPVCTNNPVRGFTQAGPCNVCDAIQDSNGGITSGMFTLVPGETGMTWTPRPEYADHLAARSPFAKAAGEAPLGSQEPPKTASKVEHPETAAPDPAPQEQASEPATAHQRAAAAQQPPAGASLTQAASATPAEQPSTPAEPAETDEAPAAAGRRVGRPPKGFTFYDGCAPIRGVGSSKTIYLSQVVERCMQAVAAQAGVADFYELETFIRRDKVMAHVLEMVEGFKTGHVVNDIGKGYTAESVATRIRALAGTVVCAL